MIQRSVFSFARASNPRELIRSNFSNSEIEHRALSYLPDELLRNAPERQSTFSLFEGFKASLPSADDEAGSSKRRKSGRPGSRGSKLLEAAEDDVKGPPKLIKAKNERDRLEHRLEMMGVRKTMCASEIREIDEKIANLNTLRKVILDRLAGLEDEEREMENELSETLSKLEVLQEEADDEIALASKSPTLGALREEKSAGDKQPGSGADTPTSISTPDKSASKVLKSSKESTPANRRKKLRRKVSTPVLHEHMESGAKIRELEAHQDIITALDFDAPFGTMVTAALDDTVRVWDLNAGRCMGMLEGHLSSVRCLQVEDNLVATGSMDATIRLWDLNQADYTPPPNSNTIRSKIPEDGEEDLPASGEDLYLDPESGDQPPAPPAKPYRADAMADCHMYTLTSHVAEITALHFRGDTLVSGSADKTLRQWDLEKGRCVQTLDVLWAAAQASTINTNGNVAPPSAFSPSFSNSTTEGGSWWRPSTSRMQAAEADFVGALQVYDAALACGTADGMVRLWDLRSGMVHRSLVGHTGPITALQFDDVFLVTGSRDRSVRVCHITPLAPGQCVLRTDTVELTIRRSGISAQATSTTPSPTMRRSRRYNSTPVASSRPLARTSSRSTIRQMATNGTAATWRARALSSVSASKTAISAKAEGTVLSVSGAAEVYGRALMKGITYDGAGLRVHHDVTLCTAIHAHSLLVCAEPTARLVNEEYSPPSNKPEALAQSSSFSHPPSSSSCKHTLSPGS